MVMTVKEHDEIMRAVALLKEAESILRMLVILKEREPGRLHVDVSIEYNSIMSARKLLEWM